MVFCERFPALSETFVQHEVRELAKQGHSVRVEAAVAPDERARDQVGDLEVTWRDQDTLARRLADVAWLAARHPLGCLRDVVSRRRWLREEWVPPLRVLAPVARRLSQAGETHVHVHFADASALSALRLSRLGGPPYSVTAHAYEIYLEPANLRAKLAGAKFVTSGCDYTVRDLQRLAPERADVIHRQVMGVDPASFRRDRPPPGDGTVTAVGRLVEKKGFVHLVEAAARVGPDGPLSRVQIIGEGPGRSLLEARIRELGLEHTVQLLGALDADGVRSVMQRSDLVAVPSVVARDGDRDSMPVVAKEALAMETPVVASDEVGLPELVRPEWGALVPPADPDALAAAITELLSVAPERRAQMGQAGREFVSGHCSIEGETARLVKLISDG